MNTMTRVLKNYKVFFPGISRSLSDLGVFVCGGRAAAEDGAAAAVDAADAEE